jgi:hypothetical protein
MPHGALAGASSGCNCHVCLIFTPLIAFRRCFVPVLSHRGLSGFLIQSRDRLDRYGAVNRCGANASGEIIERSPLIFDPL